MGKGTVIILIILIATLVGGFFYTDYKLERESGEKDGVKMGYLYGFNDAKDGKSPNTENLAMRLFVVGDSTYDKAFLAAAYSGYRRGYDEGKKED